MTSKVFKITKAFVASETYRVSDECFSYIHILYSCMRDFFRNEKTIITYISVMLVMLFLCNSLTAQEINEKGLWKKVEVSKTGLYIITKEELKNLGFESAEEVAVVGGGGELISEYLEESKDYHFEVQPSIVSKNGDLIFFATGLVNWYYDKNNDFYIHKTNHYSNNAYVMITNAVRPKRFEKEIQTPASGEKVSQYISVGLHESDMLSLSESGRDLFGENLLLDNQSIIIANTLKSKNAKFAVAWTALSKFKDVTLSLNSGGTTFVSSTITNGEYENKAALDTYRLFGLYKKTYGNSFFSIPTDKDININLSLSNTKNPAAYLDFVEVNFKNNADFSNNSQYMVRYPGGLDSPKYMNCNGLEDKIAVKINQLTNEKKLIESRDILGFDNNDIMFAVSDINGLFRIGKVEDVEIRNDILNSTSAPDMVIITTTELRGQAERLAAFHKLNDGVTVVVVTQSEVFNMFNSGTKDASCYRLLMNYLYKKRSSDTKSMSLLLFGDGLYDNRKISREVKGELFDKKEFLLTYQSDNSLDIDSYTSDDFFGVLSGRTRIYKAIDRYRQLDLENQRLDVSVGRIPVRTIEEATNVVDKIISYYNKESLGIWKATTAFVADNGDYNSHIKQSASISNIMEELQPSINCEKIYLADYKRVSVGGKITVPQAKQKMMDALKKGLLLINYNGHGSPVSWADEQILTSADIKTFNHTKLPLWITATCDFGNYDSHNTSAAEQILLLPKSGGIALFSTSRVVWDIPNTMLNKAVIRELFSNTNNKELSLGDVIRNAKNSLLNQVFPKNRLNFTLLGDPLLKIHIPSNGIEITEINGENIKKTDKNIKVNALEKVNIKAYVLENDNVDESFDGKAIVTIYDSKKEKKTIDNFSRNNNDVTPFEYEDYSNIIFSSIVKVSKGKIDFDFIVPKDVSYTNKNCRIHLYAYDDKEKKHCMGSNYDMIISPSDGNDLLDSDTTSVVVRDIKLSGIQFKSGIVVGNNPTFFADIIDDSSINLSNSSIGHSMILSIDNRVETTYSLSEYYEPSTEEYGAGTIIFQLPELAEGKHTATFSVWDVAGNVTKRTIEFTVKNNIQADIVQWNVYPNPIGISNMSNVNVDVMYNLIGKNIELSATIYTLNGDVVCSSTMKKQNYDASLNKIVASWDISRHFIPTGV